MPPKKPRVKKTRKTKKSGKIMKKRVVNPLKTDIKGVFSAYDENDPFPQIYRCKMIYASTHYLTSGSAGVFGTEQIFRLSSLFDPDYSGSGRQPYCYDEIAVLYRKYLVNAIKVDVVISDPSEDGVVAGFLLQPSLGSLALTGRGVDEVREKPMCTTRVLNNTGSQVVKFSQFLTMSQIEGLKKAQWDTSQSIYGALTSANPSLTPYLRVACASDKGTTGASIYVKLKFTYYTQFYDRVAHGSS